ncbi:unnamed protein product [Cylindrotheca closterium]|uniref:rhomboid protease n=1 Tax=Cylindrotheca closterium TaxID=2856 RepID=A0AAD2CWG7_9STRA|nr:unnamed protein product [Cylindrotheca closterium]
MALNNNHNDDESLHEDAASFTPNVDIELVAPEKNLQEWDNDDGLVYVHLGDALDEVSEDSVSTDVESGDASYYSDDYSTEETNKSFERSNSIATILFNTLRDNNESSVDPRLGRRARDFAFAQSERSLRGEKISVGGFLSLLDAVVNIRADLQWAEDAAWRRENGKPYVSWEDYEHQRKQNSWKRPYLTYAIMIVHFCAMIYVFALSDWKPESMKRNTWFGPSRDILVKAGGLDALDMAENGNYYRLVSATFLHGGVIHYLFNAPCIYYFASAIEMNHGMACLSLVYFLPSVAAFVWSALLIPGTPTLGASGGIFGLIGACVADVIINWNLMFLVFKDHIGMSKCCLKLKAAVWLFLDMAFQLVLGLLPYVDNFAHLGGFIYGFLAGFVVMERLPLSFFGKENGFRKCRSFIFRFLAAAFLAFAIAYSGVELSQSDGRTVPFPRITSNLNCVELPFWEEDKKWWRCDQCDGFQFPLDVFEMDETNIFERTIAKAEFGCPDGSSVIVDISDFEVSTFDDLPYRPMVGICRKFCY